MVNPSDYPPEQQHTLQPLHKLLQNYPFAFWSVVWVAIVFVGIGAMIGMLNPGSVEPEVSHPQPTLSTIQESRPKKASSPKSTFTTPLQDSTPKEGLPLSLFGSLALGCAAGSLVLARILKPSSTQRRPSIKRSKSSRTNNKRRQHLSKERRRVPPTPQPVSSQLTIPTPQRQILTRDDQQTQVTVLPAEENLPLDGSEENLAEMLDLRKRQSLASLMRGN